jgi:hemolysin D
MLSRQYELQKERAKTEDEYTHALAQLHRDLEDITTNRGSRKTSLSGRVQQIQQQLALAQGSLKRNLERQQLAEKQFERTRKLYESRDITVSDFEAAQERVNDGAKAIDDDRKTIASVQVELSTARDELAKLTDERTREKLEAEIKQTELRRDRDLKALDEQIASTTGQLDRSKQLVEGVDFEENNTIYSANFDGLVTSVPVNLGDLVSVGQPLFSMVRDTAPLYARVLARNESIGALAKGQEVKIKYFAYPYQEYGIQEGVISDIATKPGGVEGADSMYIVTVALKSETIARRGGKPNELEIGLEGLAEIKTGSKRMIELLFSPVSRFFNPEEE